MLFLRFFVVIFLLKNVSLHLFVSLYFRSICDSFSSSSRKGHLPLSTHFFTMLLHFSHSAYNIYTMYIILFPTLSSSHAMHLKICVLSFCLFWSVYILLHLFTIFWHINLVSQSFPFSQTYFNPVLYISSLKLDAHLSHFIFPICQS